jgi:hypothetical protein
MEQTKPLKKMNKKMAFLLAKNYSQQITTPLTHSFSSFTLLVQRATERSLGF